MSPRRVVDTEAPEYFYAPVDPPPRWGLPFVAGISALLIAVTLGYLFVFASKAPRVP